MTSADPSDRDELVAAYLDGEATTEERALVEGDPALMERAHTLRQVADLVAEPVLVPTPEVRNSHIATALAASPTAANVTSLASKRRQWPADYTAVLGAAAAIIVVLFAGTLLLANAGGDDDDSLAGGVNDAATEEFDVFDGAEGEGGTDEREALATTDGGEAASSLDEAGAAEADMAPEADEAAVEEEMAEEEMAEEEAAEISGEDAATASDDTESGDGTVASVARDVDPAVAAPTIDAFAEQVGLLLLGVGTGGDLLLACEGALDDASRGFLDPLIAGEGTIASQQVEYVVVDDFGESLLIVADATTCAVIEETPLP